MDLILITFILFLFYFSLFTFLVKQVKQVVTALGFMLGMQQKLRFM